MKSRFFLQNLVLLFLFFLGFFVNATDKPPMNVYPGNVFSEIPDRYKDYVTFTTSAIDGIQMGSTLNIRGNTKLEHAVFINGTSLVVDKKGSFSGSIFIKEMGQQPIQIYFLTPDSRYLLVQQYITFLNEPKHTADLNSNEIEFLTYLYNKDLIFNIESKTMNSTMTRLELAYFICKLDAQINQTDLSWNVENSLNEVKDEILRKVVDKHWMGLYADDRFYPDKQVTRIEFLVTLVRVLDLDLTTYYRPLQFNDIEPGNWTTIFLQAAIHNNLINSSNLFQPNIFIEFKDMMNILAKINHISEDQEQLFSNTPPNEALIENELWQNPVFEAIAAKERHNQREIFTLNSVENNQILYQDKVTFSGKIVPVEKFKINKKTINPKANGDYKVSFNLDNGFNEFNIQTDFATRNIRVFFLEGYTDLDSHWIQHTAAKLKYLNFTDSSDVFNPKQKVTRYSFANLSKQFFKEFNTVNGEINMNIEDLGFDDIHIEFISNLATQNILSLYNEAEFQPDKVMTRIEVLAALVKYSQITNPQPLKTVESQSFPFWDVPKKHWGRAFVEHAYREKWISENHNFYPSKQITKDQLIALLSNTQHAKKALQDTFKDD